MLINIKAYLYGAALAIILAACFVLWYQRGVISRLEGEKSRLAADVLKCAAANDETQATIEAMIKERGHLGASCETRLALKDKIIKELREIGEANDAEDPNDEVPAGDHTIHHNGVIDLLNGMLPLVPAANYNEDGLYQARGADHPKGADLQPGSVASNGTGTGESAYCLDEVNAKRLMTNNSLLRGWALDMEAILVTLKTSTQGVN